MATVTPSSPLLEAEARAGGASCAADEGWAEAWASLVAVSPHGQPPPLRIGESAIHGRGVFAARPLAAGEAVALMWFDFAVDDAPVDPPTDRNGSLAAYRRHRGFLGKGNEIGALEVPSVRAARALCDEDAACAGFTFQVPKTYS